MTKCMSMHICVYTYLTYARFVSNTAYKHTHGSMS